MNLTEAERDGLCDAVMDYTTTRTAAAPLRMDKYVVPAVEKIIAARVLEFAQWVASNRAYNGSDHQYGQSLYNECLNGVLPQWAAEFVTEEALAAGEVP